MNDLKEGEMVCPECKGRCTEPGYLRFCFKCGKTGKVDWVSRAVAVDPKASFNDKILKQIFGNNKSKHYITDFSTGSDNLVNIKWRNPNIPKNLIN